MFGIERNKQSVNFEQDSCTQSDEQVDPIINLQRRRNDGMSYQLHDIIQPLGSDSSNVSPLKVTPLCSGPAQTGPSASQTGWQTHKHTLYTHRGNKHLCLSIRRPGHDDSAHLSKSIHLQKHGLEVSASKMAAKRFLKKENRLVQTLIKHAHTSSPIKRFILFFSTWCLSGLNE